jgi:hypothetical protein
MPGRFAWARCGRCTNLHLLEMSILQYVFLDCVKEYNKDENNNEDYF